MWLATTSVFAAQPNILLIVGDDMSFADVGFHGCKDIPTPNLDALATSAKQRTSGMSAMSSRAGAVVAATTTVPSPEPRENDDTGRRVSVLFSLAGTLFLVYSEQPDLVPRVILSEG